LEGFLAVFSPPFGRARVPKGGEKTAKNLPRRGSGFPQNTIPKKNETSPEKGAEMGAKISQKSFPGSPARPHGHPIAPGDSHDPPGRPFGHPCGTVFEHFGIALFMLDKFRPKIYPKFSTSPLYFEY